MRAMSVRASRADSLRQNPQLVTARRMTSWTARPADTAAAGDIGIGHEDAAIMKRKNDSNLQPAADTQAEFMDTAKI
jgi:hypothetical protein